MGGAHYDTMFASVKIYDPQTNIWTELKHMPVNRVWHGSGVINNNIYVFGGATGFGAQTAFLPTTWKYEPMGDLIDIEADMQDTIVVFAYATALDQDGNKCLYVIGGTTYNFWLPGGGGPYVSNVSLKYCPIISSTKNEESSSASFVLFQNYPNPFSSTTLIKYELRNPTNISIKIFDIAGKEVATIFQGFQQAEEHEIEWNADGLKNGVYLFELETEEGIDTKRCILQN
jgi:hypothetical protein